MNRRNLLRASGLAGIVGLAGCLGRIQAITAGPVRPAGGHAALHPAETPYVDGGLGVGDGPAFAARYVQRLPERQPLTAAALDDDLGPLEPSDFETGFVLLVEARAPLAERVRLGPTVRFDPEWTGLGRLRVPIVVEDATDVDPSLLDDADPVVCTLLARYRARRLPRSVTVSLRDAATGGRLDTIEARRLP